MHYLGQVPDLPLPHIGGPRLRTRRRPLARIVLCQGCCGQTDCGLPAVSLDWLKPLWKAEGWGVKTVFQAHLPLYLVPALPATGVCNHAAIE